MGAIGRSTGQAMTFIQLPPSESFEKHDNYYATTKHELCHWTGHPSRLNRVLSSRHDIEAHAYEERVAESSLLVCPLWTISTSEARQLHRQLARCATP